MPENPAITDIRAAKDRYLDRLMHIDGKLAGLDAAIKALVAERMAIDDERRELIATHGDANRAIADIAYMERSHRRVPAKPEPIRGRSQPGRNHRTS